MQSAVALQDSVDRQRRSKSISSATNLMLDKGTVVRRAAEQGDKEGGSGPDDCKSLEHLYDQLQEASAMRSSSTAGPLELPATSLKGRPRFHPPGANIMLGLAK